ncbi:MAG TPA: efflux RND transporter periplasmic adaptor subunit, partial [Clostridia bacterium]|nr:efflux RND transporter periplasmic adaptor subunit [Clostridia bacterium]
MEIKALFNKNKGSETSPQPQNKKRIKRLRKWIILGAAVLVIAGIIANCSLQTKKLASMVAFSETAILKKTDLISSIGGTGTVESNRSSMVYSTQAYPVKAVYVKVGDYVEAGGLLCELDASALINQIETQELTTGVSAKAALSQVKSASDNYSLAKELLDEGLNTAVLAAENNVRATYDAWQKAQRMYSTALNSSDNPTLTAADAAYNSALSAFEAAKTNLNNAEQAYNLAKANFEAMSPPPDNSAAISDAEGALAAAQAALKAALNETTMDPNKVLQARSV